MVRRLVWDQDFAGSIPVTPTIRACSSAGRALRSQRRGHGFESHQVHQIFFLPRKKRVFTRHTPHRLRRRSSVGQSVRFTSERSWVRAPSSPQKRKTAHRGCFFFLADTGCENPCSSHRKTASALMISVPSSRMIYASRRRSAHAGNSVLFYRTIFVLLFYICRAIMRYVQGCRAVARKKKTQMHIKGDYA